MKRFNTLKFDKKGTETKPRKSTYEIDGYPTTLEEAWDTIRNLSAQIKDLEKRLMDADRLIESHNMRLIEVEAGVEQLHYDVHGNHKEDASDTTMDEEWGEVSEDLMMRPVPDAQRYKEVIVIDDDLVDREGSEDIEIRQIK